MDIDHIDLGHIVDIDHIDIDNIDIDTAREIKKKPIYDVHTYFYQCTDM